MEAYRTEEEQVEALKRWWDENGKSTIAAIVIAISGVVVFQTWQGQREATQSGASDAYQELVNRLGTAQQTGDDAPVKAQALEIKGTFDGTSYAQFAAMHLARLGVEEGDLATAETELRWILSQADRDSDIAQIAELRLARIIAANGDTDQALGILTAREQSAYAASFALARGDILYATGRDQEAREAYLQAQLKAAELGIQGQMTGLQQKIDSLTPVPPRSLVEIDEETAALETE